MSLFTARLEEHQVQEHLRVLAHAVELALERGNLSPDMTTSLERVEQVRLWAVTRLRSTDPFLVPQQTLDQMAASAHSLLNEIQHFASNGNVGHVANATSHADTLLIQTTNLPAVATPADLKSMADGIKRLRRSVGQYKRYVYDERKGLLEPIEKARADLAALSSEIENQRSRSDAVISEFQDQFSRGEEERREAAGSAERQRLDDWQAVTQKHQEEFIEVMTSREEQVDELIERLKAEAEEHYNQWSKVFSDLNTELNSKVTDEIIAITSHKEQAEALIHVIGNTGMVGGYQKTADQKRTAARIWQSVAAAAFVGLISFAIYTFVATTGEAETFPWTQVSGRAFVALTFGILAAYAARQADRLQASEDANRRVELALASVDPYLASLPKEAGDEVKRALAEKFFALEQPPQIERKQRRITGTSADIARMALEALKDLIKKT